jgi:hypothetical protein
MSEPEKPEGTTPKPRAAHVRFQKNQFLRIAKDRLVTGKSIPWLLRTAYFEGGISPATLDPESRAVIRRELGAIGNNVNQIARAANRQGHADLEHAALDMLKELSELKRFLLRDYGDR